MALDPRISLAGVVPSNATALNLFENALTNSTNRGIASAQEARRAEAAPFQQQMLEQQAASGAAQATDDRSKRRFNEIYQLGQRVKPYLERGDTQGAQNFMLNHISGLQDRIEAGEDIDITESMETLQKLQQGDVQGVMGDIAAVNGLFNQQAGRGQTANQREFDSLMRVFEDPNSTKAQKDAAGVSLGITARVGSSAGERAAQDAVLGQQVVDQVTAEAKGKETGKSKAQLRFAPQIAKAVKLAEAKAKEEGDVLNDLARAEAGLPGLIKATESLKELASAATSTYGGRFFDAIAKESGWGSTKGANARAKYIAIIDNQVLPLLKQTFGGAMTEGEGLRLSNTLGDPNASPEQKILQTEAFIDQKRRDIETLKNQTPTTEAGINEFAGFKVVR